MPGKKAKIKSQTKMMEYDQDPSLENVDYKDLVEIKESVRY